MRLWIILSRTSTVKFNPSCRSWLGYLEMEEDAESKSKAEDEEVDETPNQLHREGI